MSITSRYEFLYLVECIDSNPNGDPDAGNSPRIDPQSMQGLISDVSVKRRIRNYVSLVKKNTDSYNILIQMSTNINKFIAKAHEMTKGNARKGNKEETKAAQKWLCANYYNVRTFGGVLSVGANAGQVRGPVQLTFLRSIEPILALDMTITRMAITETLRKENATFDDYESDEKKRDEDRMRTIGRKQMIPFGLYEGRGFISANLAEETGFEDEDLSLLFEALANMYDHDRSASKGQMSTVLPIILFKHVGTDSDVQQRLRQSMLGCAPAQKLFELVKLSKRPDVILPRSYLDYELTIQVSKLPKGVEIGFAVPDCNGINITFGQLPDGYDWIKLI